MAGTVQQPQEEASNSSLFAQRSHAFHSHGRTMPLPKQHSYATVSSGPASRRSSSGLQDEHSGYSSYSKSSHSGGGTANDLHIKRMPLERHAEHPLQGGQDGQLGLLSMAQPLGMQAAASPAARPGLTLRAQPFTNSHLQAVAMAAHMPTVITTREVLFQTDPVEEMMANFNMTRAIHSHMQQRKVWHAQQLERLNETRDSMAAAQAACYRSVDVLGLLARPMSGKSTYSRVNSRTSRRRPTGDSGVSHSDSRGARGTGDEGERPVTAHTDGYADVVGHEQVLVQTEGAYLTHPDYSFSGTRPIRGVPERGVFFEKYTKDSSPASAIQTFYLRPTPDRAAAAQQLQWDGAATAPLPYQYEYHRRGTAAVHDRRQPPKALFNGVPHSRLEHLHALNDQGRTREWASQARTNLAAAHQSAATPAVMLTQTTMVTLINGDDPHAYDVPALTTDPSKVHAAAGSFAAEVFATMSAQAPGGDVTTIPTEGDAPRRGSGDDAPALRRDISPTARGVSGGSTVRRPSWKPPLPGSKVPLAPLLAAEASEASAPGASPQVPASPSARSSCSAAAIAAAVSQAAAAAALCSGNDASAVETPAAAGSAPSEPAAIAADAATPSAAVAAGNNPGSTAAPQSGPRSSHLLPLTGIVKVDPPEVKKLMDESFFEALKEHFKDVSPVVEQTRKLRSTLNANLPSLMHHIGGVHSPMRARRRAPVLR